MTAPMPVADAMKDQETYYRAQEEAALRTSIKLLARLPGDRRAATIYLEASRQYELRKVS